MAQAGRSARRWRALVPVVCLVAGLGFATSAHESAGTELRAPGIASLADTVRGAEARGQTLALQVSGLQRSLERATSRAGAGDGRVRSAQRRLAPLRVPAGLSAEHGAGLTVVLDDASSVPSGTAVDPNQLVVHQSDLQAVVNALWAGGAEAMSISGQRVIATSAVRCVGNTLLLNGTVDSPPFRIVAIGPSGSMQNRLAASPGVRLFEQAAEYYGLGYTVEAADDVRIPAYRGPLTLVYAHAGPAPHHR